MTEAIYNFKSIKAIATGLKDYESEVGEPLVFVSESGQIGVMQGVDPQPTAEPAEVWHVYWQENLYGPLNATDDGAGLG